MNDLILNKTNKPSLVWVMVWVFVFILSIGSAVADEVVVHSESDTLSVQAAADSLIVSPAEDFVNVSVLVASEGKMLYSALGHACLRLECPTHHLDYIFSDEAESVQHNIPRFFAGKLTTRVMAIPTSEYLQQYVDEGRGVLSYKVNLPIQTKQHLWEMMDNRVAEGPHPFDFVNYSCAISVYRWLLGAIGKDNVTIEKWPDTFDKSRYELGDIVLAESWNRFFLGTVCQGEILDASVPNSKKVIIPNDMLKVLHETKAYGQPLLDKEPQVLVEKTGVIQRAKPMPLTVAVAMLCMASINLFFHWKPLRWIVAIPLLLLGAFCSYLVFLSHLPAKQWNWLVIPFCPVPFVFWNWRRYWGYAMAAVCVAWCVAMLLSSHTLVFTPHVVLAFAMALIYIEIVIQQKRIVTNKIVIKK